MGQQLPAQMLWMLHWNALCSVCWPGHISRHSMSARGACIRLSCSACMAIRHIGKQEMSKGSELKGHTGSAHSVTLKPNWTEIEGKPILDCWSDSLAFCLLPFVVGLAQIWGTDYHCLFYVYVYYSHSATKHEQDVVKYAVLQSSAFQVLTWSSFQLMTSMSKSTAAAHARCGSVNLLHAHVCLWSSATAVGYAPMSWKRMPSSMGHIAAMTGKTVTTG